MLKFTLLGVPVGVDWWFWLTTLLLGGAASAHGPDAWARVAVWTAVVFVSILVHEFGHALAGRRYGATPVIHLQGFGGVTILPGGRFTRPQSILVSAAGPAAGLLLGLIVLGLRSLRSELPPLVQLAVWDALYVNFFWTLVNLLPIQPLDGGQILTHALGPRAGRAVGIIGFVTAAALCVWSFLDGQLFMALMLAMLAYYNLRRIPVQGGVITPYGKIRMEFTRAMIGGPQIAFFFVLGLSSMLSGAETNSPAWLGRPLSVAECVDQALQRNSTIKKAQSDLEAAYGVVIQTRAIAIPKIRTTSSYQKTDPGGVETFPPVNLPFDPFPNIRVDERWAAEVRLVQSIYEGSRITSALRTARLTKEQAILQYQTVVADTLLAVRVAYDDVLLARQQITVQEASVNLLTNELEDQRRRFDAGTVPRFNVLRAEVEVANARPRLISARNSYRISKNQLANLLGFDLPKDVWEDIPLNLTGQLAAEPFDIELPVALAQALQNRTELSALQKGISLAKESVVNAQSGWKPSVQAFAGYGSRSSQFSTDLTRDVSGWFVGAQLNWDIFDGLYTKGRIDQARALHRRAEYDLEDNSRRVELEVRTAYSNFVEAREVLESQTKVQELAEEALRLATVRSQAGTGTQLDVLNAQTSLTQARTTQIQALRDYAVARARLERAIGVNVMQQR